MLDPFATIAPTHAAAHVCIFFGYIAAMVLVPQSFGRLMYLHPATKIAAAGFFLCCGVTHIGLAFQHPYSLVVEVNDHLQAGFILTFVFSLVRDLNRAIDRLTRAFNAIGLKFGEEVQQVVQQTVRKALEGK